MKSENINNIIFNVAELSFHLIQACIDNFNIEDKKQDKNIISRKFLTLSCEGLKCFSIQHPEILFFKRKFIRLINKSKILTPRDKLIFDFIRDCEDNKSYELFNYSSEDDKAVMLKNGFHKLQLMGMPNKSMECLSYLVNQNSDQVNKLTKGTHNEWDLKG